MPTAVPRVELTVVEQGGVDVFVLDAPATQIAIGPAISTATPQPIGTATAGTTGESSDAGHVHAHGNQSGGSLHAVATSGSAGFLSSTLFSLLNGATSASTASAIVRRDANGNFSAGTITAALTGNAATATKLNSARTFALTGNVTGSVSSDLAAGASIATAIGSGVITDAMVAAGANIALTKLASGRALQESILIYQNASLSIGQPGTVPFGVGPAVDASLVFVGLGPDSYNPIHLPSASFM